MFSDHRIADLDTFRAAFKGDLVTPSDPEYNQAIARFANNAVRRAEVIAFVKTLEDVRLAIKYARDSEFRIAIRGGGHSIAGASSSEDGLVIDLSKYMHYVKIDPDKKLAYVGGGALWKTVDEAAIEYGLATTGGTVNHTGVAGLLLGGGFGWLSGSHGLVIDNLVEATVVTANGDILKASDTENPDLFFGIRGGGSNFGVATEFTLKLHPQRRTVFAGRLAFGSEKCKEISAALDVWWPNATEKEGLYAVMTRDPHGNSCVVTLLFYNGSADEGKAKFKSFYDIGPALDTCREIPYEELNTMLHDIATPGLNYYMKGLYLSPQPSKDVNPEHLEKVVKLSESGMHNYVSLVCEYIPYGKINSVPKDATPYPRDIKGNAVALVQWENDTPEKSKMARDAVRELTTLMPEGEGYTNYSPDSEILPREGSAPSSKTQAMFREHYPRLQSIKRKYDPDMVFNKWFVVAPATA